ncbi:SWI/SNF-related matrix-associated actin-dependent regulator of chromatin subfamily D member 3-like, partial [Notechis scutatus]|uniref:SWI/SNF-related matrix-associated actin-dependent regulator of chromatin subfamily D member 3-like n=1 Tax=Notechis scutatus TaxID=8663 RepID=A0A6J1W880_9SAUR
MAAEEVSGGARKATKSKLFEFLVHGVRPGMPSGARMPHQGAPMGPPGAPYVGSASVRPGMPPAVTEPTRKRAAPQPQPPPPAQAQPQAQPPPPPQAQQQQQQQAQGAAPQNRSRSAKRRKMADKILPQR